jgi:hypothetical protein
MNIWSAQNPNIEDISVQSEQISKNINPHMGAFMSQQSKAPSSIL